MKEITVVIGANYGDEGKGLMTDYFAVKKSNTLVVRFNGGAQAAHTVVTPEGISHAFGHFGSGTFTGAPTYLSNFFVVNPMLFKKEYLELQRLGVTPKVFIDGDCLVTTPYDVIINQIAETVLGDTRHGSCGVGFNETLQRKSPTFNVKMAADLEFVESILNRIQSFYVSKRLGELGIKDAQVPGRFIELLSSGDIISSYLEDVQFMLNNAVVVSNVILNVFDNVIFEGAQGLLLDQSHPFFPHVTHSNTGVKNVVSILRNIDHFTTRVDVTYVTRAYMTRHGAGPFPTELPGKPSSKIEDPTNIPNEYQGSMRFGLLNLDSLQASIWRDLCYLEMFKHSTDIALTCLDQFANELRVVRGGVVINTTVGSLPAVIHSATGLDVTYRSYGPTRTMVKNIWG
jgi:adenylosuccinate synthase